MRDPDPTARRGLSDPAHAAHAWRRFRRILSWMALAAALTVAAVLWWLKLTLGPLPWAMIGAVVAGVGLTILMGAALMGLVFMSSGTGHDEDVDQFNERIWSVEDKDD